MIAKSALLTKISWAAASAMLMAGFRFLITAILAKKLDKHTFGLYAYIQWICDLSFLLLSFGASACINRYLVDDKHSTHRLTLTASYFNKAIYALPPAIATAAAGAVWLMKISTNNAEIVTVWLLAYCSSLWQLKGAALTAKQKFKRIFYINIGWATLCSAPIYFMPSNLTTPTLIFLLFASSSLLAAALCYTEQEKTATINEDVNEKAWKRQLLTYARNMWITSILWNLAWARGEFPLVERILGIQSVAEYAVAFSLIGGATQALMLIVGGVLPTLTKLVAGGEMQQAASIARRVSEWQLLITAFIAIPLVLFSHELITSFFGKDYLEAATLVAVMSPGLIALTFACQLHILQILSDGKFNRNITILAISTLYIAAPILIWYIDLKGAALGRAITLLVYGGTALFFSRMRIGLLAYPVSQLFLVIVCLATAAVTVVNWSALGIVNRVTILFILLAACCVHFHAQSKVDRRLVIN